VKSEPLNIPRQHPTAYPEKVAKMGSSAMFAERFFHSSMLQLFRTRRGRGKPLGDAERLNLRSHAERGNERVRQDSA